jgi:RimJ/RimL family protein N-acetyltransferase
MTADLPGPAYRIITDRLMIRCFNPTDATLMIKAIEENLEHLKPWMVWAHDEPETLNEKIERLRKIRGEFDLGLDFMYGIFNLEETQLLGGTGLHTRIGPGAREIGYWIHKDFINQGLATESSAALVRVAFEIDKVKRVEIHCTPDNIRSSAIPRKLGFSHEATLQKRTPSIDGKMLDTTIWTMFDEEYPSSFSAQVRIQAYDASDRPLI